MLTIPQCVDVSIRNVIILLATLAPLVDRKMVLAMLKRGFQFVSRQLYVLIGHSLYNRCDGTTPFCPRDDVAEFGVGMLQIQNNNEQQQTNVFFFI
jgi:hypothetical protein